MKELKRPKIGEDYKGGKVIKITEWSDEEIQDYLKQDPHLETRVAHFLGDPSLYFEFLVQYPDGEVDSFDWSEYKDNF